MSISTRIASPDDNLASSLDAIQNQLATQLNVSLDGIQKQLDTFDPEKVASIQKKLDDIAKKQFEKGTETKIALTDFVPEKELFESTLANRSELDSVTFQLLEQKIRDTRYYSTEIEKQTQKELAQIARDAAKKTTDATTALDIAMRQTSASLEKLNDEYKQNLSTIKSRITSKYSNLEKTALQSIIEKLAAIDAKLAQETARKNETKNKHDITKLPISIDAAGKHAHQKATAYYNQHASDAVTRMIAIEVENERKLTVQRKNARETELHQTLAPLKNAAEDAKKAEEKAMQDAYGSGQANLAMNLAPKILALIKLLDQQYPINKPRIEICKYLIENVFAFCGNDLEKANNEIFSYYLVNKHNKEARILAAAKNNSPKRNVDTKVNVSPVIDRKERATEIQKQEKKEKTDNRQFLTDLKNALENKRMGIIYDTYTPQQERLYSRVATVAYRNSCVDGSESELLESARSLKRNLDRLHDEIANLNLKNPFEELESVFNTYKAAIKKCEEQNKNSIIPTAIRFKLDPLKETTAKLVSNYKDAVTHIKNQIEKFPEIEGFSKKDIETRLRATAKTDRAALKDALIKELKQQRTTLTTTYESLNKNLTYELKRHSNSRIRSVIESDAAQFALSDESLFPLPDNNSIIAAIQRLQKSANTPDSLFMQACKQIFTYDQKLYDICQLVTDVEIQLPQKRLEALFRHYPVLDHAMHELAIASEEKQIATNIENERSFLQVRLNDLAKTGVAENTASISSSLNYFMKRLQKTYHEKATPVRALFQKAYDEELSKLPKAQKESQAYYRDIWDRLSARLPIELKRKADEYTRTLIDLNTTDAMKQQAKENFDTQWKQQLSAYEMQIKQLQTTLQTTPAAKHLRQQNEEKYVTDIFNAVNLAEVNDIKETRAKDLQEKTSALTQAIKNAADARKGETTLSPAAADAKRIVAENRTQQAADLLKECDDEQTETVTKPKTPSKGRLVASIAAGILFPIAIIYGGYLKCTQKTGSKILGAILGTLGIIAFPFWPWTWHRGVNKIYNGETGKYFSKPLTDNEIATPLLSREDRRSSVTIISPYERSPTTTPMLIPAAHAHPSLNRFLLRQSDNKPSEKKLSLENGLLILKNGNAHGDMKLNQIATDLVTRILDLVKPETNLRVDSHASFLTIDTGNVRLHINPAASNLENLVFDIGLHGTITPLRTSQFMDDGQLRDVLYPSAKSHVSTGYIPPGNPAPVVERFTFGNR
jgi:hypothetical protein